MKFSTHYHYKDNIRNVRAFVHSSVGDVKWFRSLRAARSTSILRISTVCAAGWRLELNSSRGWLWGDRLRRRQGDSVGDRRSWCSHLGWRLKRHRTLKSSLDQGIFKQKKTQACVFASEKHGSFINLFDCSITWRRRFSQQCCRQIGSCQAHQACVYLTLW